VNSFTVVNILSTAKMLIEVNGIHPSLASRCNPQISAARRGRAEKVPSAMVA
jgi:hypothetical protein